MIPIDTSNILFICGVAFEGLDKIINERLGKQQIGFATNQSKKKIVDNYKIYSEMLPQDLLKFGLIPEFVGRLPILATLHDLDRKALVDVMTKPKNALVKQYKKLLKYDNVTLEFDKEALEAMVDKALERKTGARGLRSIMEETMRDIMYEIPSNPEIKKCRITKEVVIDKAEAIKE